MDNQTKDLTRGPIGRQVFFFALPLLGGSLIQQLYNTVDLIFVGQFLGKSASAAVGAGSLLVTCILGFFTGLGVGVGILAARAFAMGKRRTGADCPLYRRTGIAFFGFLPYRSNFYSHISPMAEHTGKCYGPGCGLPEDLYVQSFFYCQL